MGVRPSSGAAIAGCSDAVDFIGGRCGCNIAAPEDGRTPHAHDPLRVGAITCSLQLECVPEREILVAVNPYEKPNLRRRRGVGILILLAVAWQCFAALGAAPD